RRPRRCRLGFTRIGCACAVQTEVWLSCRVGTAPGEGDVLAGVPGAVPFEDEGVDLVRRRLALRADLSGPRLAPGKVLHPRRLAFARRTREGLGRGTQETGDDDAPRGSVRRDLHLDRRKLEPQHLGAENL